MRAWTWLHNPFRLGGKYDVMASEVGEPLDTLEIRGFKLGLFENPHARLYHIADMESGGLVAIGSSRGEAYLRVMTDINTGDPEVMGKQIERARKVGSSPDVEVEADEFWRRLAKAKEES